MTATATGESIPDWSKWDPKAQEELLRRLKTDQKVWYCNVGRTCDGKPHEGVDYRHARGDQWPPPGADWTVWAALSGRGGGKTATGSHWTRKLAERKVRIGIIAPTSTDLREVIVEGESGILAACEFAGVRADYMPSKSRVEFPGSGAIVHLYSAEKPRKLRGPQHHYIWLDEAAHMQNIAEVWDMALLGLRLGANPRALITTTPMPSKWMKSVVGDPGTRVVRVSTYANLENLAPTFAEAILKRYEGTRLGRQELYGEILEDVEGALWSYDNFTYLDDGDERTPQEVAKTLERIIVAVDPAGTSSSRSDETGIIVIGAKGDHLFVLADRSGRYSPHAWARTVVETFEEFGADRVVAEKNYGGDMVLATLRGAASYLPVDMVTSRRGKFIRAEPIHSLYEQGRVIHTKVLEELEAQLTSWVPGTGKSPDRLDALVHGAHALAKITTPVQVGDPTSLIIARQMPDIPHMRVLKDIARSTS